MTLTTNFTTTGTVPKAKPGKTRIACYERVSTEEQAIHGYSIPAQKEVLTAYCKSHDYIIIGHYTDEGISGAKPASKRPAMARLLQDVEHGLVDLVLFCKLDRWFRNVQEYFKVQEVLDAHGCSWNAVQEDYETETANGRMIVSIMLSLAQKEREKTAERVRAVFDYRAAKGEFLTGGRAIPYGYQLNGKQLEKDPSTAPVVERLFSLVLGGQSVTSSLRIIRQEYPDAPTTSCLRRILYNPHYAGIHNGIPGWCPAYITESQHSTLLGLKHTRSPKDENAVYLFTGLLICPECGRKLILSRCKQHGNLYSYYFCSNAQWEKRCGFKRWLSENKTETALTAYLFKPGQIIVEDAKPATTARKTQINVGAIESKLKRLAETYTDGLIDRETYKRKLAELTTQLETAKNAPRIVSKPPEALTREILQGDLQTVYNRFTRQEKRRFWQTVLTSLVVGADYSIIRLAFNTAPSSY